MKVYSFESFSSTTVKALLKNNLTGFSSFDIARALKNKDVKVNGKRVHTDIALNKGDYVQIYLSPRKYYDVIYSDSNIVVLNKLLGIETNSVDDQKQTLLTELKAQYPTARPVHRLDTNTLGIIVFALNENSETELLHAFKNGKVIKKYVATVASKNVKTSDKFLDSYNKNAGIVRFAPPLHDGKDARLEYECLSVDNDLATLLIILHTGKTHQIRAQLSYHGIYILGDGKYGDKTLNRKYHKSIQSLKSVYLHFTNLKALKYLENMPFSIL